MFSVTQCVRQPGLDVRRDGLKQTKNVFVGHALMLSQGWPVDTHTKRVPSLVTYGRRGLAEITRHGQPYTERAEN